MNGKLVIALVGGAAIAAILVANLGSANRTTAKNSLSSAPLGEVPQDTSTPLPSAIENGLNEVVLTVRPAVVSISAHLDNIDNQNTTGMQLLEPFHTDTTGVGSGIILDRAGHILTHRQVTKEANVIRVSLFRSGQNTFLANLVAIDPQTDLALFRLPFAAKLPVAKLGDSSALRSGDIVLAIGSPFGLTETVTQGIVSASRRRVAVEDLGFLDLIQTDAATNQGNCGGPLVNIRGDVVGINLAIFSPDKAFSGIGFAISSNQARSFYQRVVGGVL